MTTLPRHLAVLSGLALALVIAPAGAHPARFSRGGFRLESSRLFAHENAGRAVISVERSPMEATVAAQIRYVTIGKSAVAPFDFRSVKGELDFSAGQLRRSFSVQIIDHGVYTLPKTIAVSLFGAHSTPMGRPRESTLTILEDDPAVATVAGNPLGLQPAPSGRNPIAGATFFVDHKSEAAHAARRYPALRVIADQPGTARFGSFSWPDPGLGVSDYLTRAAVQEPGTVPMIATYRLVHGCHNGGDSPRDVAAYHNFVVRFANGIGDFRAVLFLEMDSVITTPCLSPHGYAVRMHELRDAIGILVAHCPRLVIYLDAGAADALKARDAARALNRAGVAKIKGFFLNATHFDWTSSEIRYGEQVSRMTGGKHFVVNTGENGQGPLVPANRVLEGNEVLCNPLGRGLGPRPTTRTGYRNVDAFAWTSNPGESGGACVAGAPPTGAYWPAYALMLARNADFGVR